MTASAADGDGTRWEAREHGPDPRPDHRPGSASEHALQRRLGSDSRADRFYDEQVLDHLNERMREFTRQQEMFFLATSDRNGECDSSFRAGPPGFLRVLDERTLVFPEYRGNGVHASLGNIEDNPHLGILLVDFVRARIGLHINGSAEVVEDAALRATGVELPEDSVPGRRALLWVRVTVEEAYIHCAKHIPQLQKAPRRTARDWGTDDYKRKGGDFFGAARDAREARKTEEATPVRPEPAPAPTGQHAPAAPEIPAARTPRAQSPATPPEPAQPTAPSAVSAAITARAETGPGSGSGSGSGTVNGSGTEAAGPGVRDVTAWREQAERALAEARRRGAEREPAPFQGWFG